VNFFGGAPSEHVFIYDHHSKKTLEKLLKRDIPIVGSDIKGFYRYFGSNSCSLAKRDGVKCRGFMFLAEEEELAILEEDYGGFKKTKVVIYDTNGNKSNGVTFIKANIPWGVPNIDYLKKVYITVKQGWDDVDGQERLFVYNDEYQLMGFYDGSKYIDESVDTDITKISLTHPSPFLKRLQDKEPTLFIKEESQAFSQYSKICPANRRRYPVILSKAEKERIDKEAPGSYSSVAEYGTDPKKKYYYICPRYWNLKTNMPVNPEDVDPSKVIDEKTKEADLTKKYIFEFSTKAHGHHALASFLDKKSHPKGHFIPCCFKMNKKNEIPKLQKKRAEEAAKHMRKLSNANTGANENANVENAEEKVADYIQNGLKFPLPKSRIGELTAPLESFFNVSHIDYYTNPKKRKLKLKKLCLFRMGVESSSSQSFLAAVAYIFYKTGSIDEPTIQSMKDLIINKINIDNIQNFHNGSLASTFAKPDYDTQSIEEYTESKLFEQMGDTVGFKKIVNGYEHFKQYLNDDADVDYTYLWDIICSGVLHRKRKVMNMVILNETMDDVTQNINIICPTTVHSNFLFNLKRKSFFIYKRGDYYEPIIGQTVSKNTVQDPFFTIEQIPFMTKILETINVHLGECKGKIINKYYRFEKNISLDELLRILDKMPDYKVISQVMNYDGKIIAVIVENKHRFYVPCAPSSVTDIPYELIGDDYWNSYPVTVKYLKKLYLESEKRIPCLPKFRVIDREKIIGVLTMTNQFIMLKNPENQDYNDDGLINIDDSHYIHYNDEEYENYNKVLTNSEVKEEYNVIDKLKLETYFYNAYYNTLKVAIGDIANLDLRKRLEEVIHNDEIYKDQFLEMKDILDPLIDSLFTFKKYSKDILKEIVEINLCKKERNYFYCTPDGKLSIPVKNLYTKEYNADVYLRKFIDNLLRNHHIQVSIFNEAHSTVYYTDQYNLTENELLILESMLMPYIDTLGPVVKKNKYIEFRSMEDLTPHEIFEMIDPVAEEDVDVNYNYNTNTEWPEGITQTPFVGSPEDIKLENVTPESPENLSPESLEGLTPDSLTPESPSPESPEGLIPEVRKFTTKSRNVSVKNETKTPNSSVINETESNNSPIINAANSNNSPEESPNSNNSPVRTFTKPNNSPNSPVITFTKPNNSPNSPVRTFTKPNNSPESSNSSNSNNSPDSRNTPPKNSPSLNADPSPEFNLSKIRKFTSKLPVIPKLRTFVSKEGFDKSPNETPIRAFYTKRQGNSNQSFNSNLALNKTSSNSNISSKKTEKDESSDEDESRDDETSDSSESSESSDESEPRDGETSESSESSESSDEDDSSESSESSESSDEGEPRNEGAFSDESKSSESSNESEPIESNNEDIPIRRINRNAKTDIWKTEFREGRHKCIHKMYLTKVWAKFFKKGTTSIIRFGTDNLKENPIPEKECNYFLLNIILKDYENSNANYNKQYIDKLIIAGYRKHFKEETQKLILKKWVKEKTEGVMNIYQATHKLKKLETYIQTTEYLITLIDLIMFMSASKIPILLIYQSKKTESSDGVKLFYMRESDFYYIIKLRNNRIFMLHMWTIAKNMRNNVTQIKFSKDNMTEALQRKLTKISSVNDYFKSSM
jgi:hypothetical protein